MRQTFRFSRAALCFAVLGGLTVVAGLLYLSNACPRVQELGTIAVPRPLPVCSVEPLIELSDPLAVAFEERSGTAGSPDVESMRPMTIRALARFERIVRSVGGAIAVKSGFRPKAYQAHLREVWEKWRELQTHVEPSCRGLRTEVRREFLRHGLLPTQRPVPVSDHTLGIGFDAAVSVPAGARLHRRRVTVDLLARLSGFKRPDVFRDPVHFRLIGARVVRS